MLVRKQKRLNAWPYCVAFQLVNDMKTQLSLPYGGLGWWKIGKRVQFYTIKRDSNVTGSGTCSFGVLLDGVDNSFPKYLESQFVHSGFYNYFSYI